LENGSNAAFGYRVKNDSIIMRMKYMNIDAIGPAGSINSNVKDMAKWVTTWINGGKYNGKEIIPASYATQAISSQMVIGAGLPSPESPDLQFSNYGLAWFLSSYRGHYRVEHGGNIDGFSANTSFFPTDSIGIVILTNQNGSSLPSIIRNTIIDKMLKLPYRNWDKIIRNQIARSKEAAATRQNSDSLNRKSGTRPSHVISDYDGRYNNDGYGTIIVTRTGDSLKANFNTINVRLRHYHYDIFNAWVLDETMRWNPNRNLRNFVSKWITKVISVRLW
jgi:CubicO group peptidase (beta-lactamase class C family)